MLFQELHIKRTHWDSSLSESHKRKYLKLISETEELNKIRVKRALQSSKAVTINREIHGFSDASESAISAVAYLRTTYREFGPDVRLIASKTKVASPPGKTDNTETRAVGSFDTFSCKTITISNN